MSQNNKQIGIIFDLDGTLLDSSDFFLQDIPKKIADYYGVEFSPLKQEKIASLFFDVFGGQKGGGKFLVVKVMWNVAKKFGVPWRKRFKFLKITHDIYQQGLSEIPLIKNIENTLNNAMKRLSIERDLYAYDITGKFWIDIDTEEDLRMLYEFLETYGWDSFQTYK